MIKNRLLAAMAAITLMSTAAYANTQQQLSNINKILQENPEIIVSVHDSLVNYLDNQDKFEQTLSRNYNYLYRNPDHSWFGAESPELTIINFTDYSCPWCKKLDPVLEQLVEKYPEEIKVVNIYVPIKEMRNELNSAGFALNLWEHKPEKYAQAHEMLVAKPGVHDTKSIERIATKLDVEEYVERDQQKDSMLFKNYQLFNDLGIRGTPGMLIDGEIIAGYMPLERLELVVLDKLKD